jgi:hypothetical protein
VSGAEHFLDQRSSWAPSKDFSRDSNTVQVVGDCRESLPAMLDKIPLALRRHEVTDTGGNPRHDVDNRQTRATATRHCHGLVQCRMMRSARIDIDENAPHASHRSLLTTECGMHRLWHPSCRSSNDRALTAVARGRPQFVFPFQFASVALRTHLGSADFPQGWGILRTNAPHA